MMDKHKLVVDAYDAKINGVYFTGDSMVIQWFSPFAGFGELELRGEGDSHLTYHTEFMSTDTERSFIEDILMKLVNFGRVEM